jgi:hypothetical protein
MAPNYRASSEYGVEGKYMGRYSHNLRPLQDLPEGNGRKPQKSSTNVPSKMEWWVI